MASSYVNGKWFYVPIFITTTRLPLRRTACTERSEVFIFQFIIESRSNREACRKGRALLCDKNPIQLSLEIQMIMFAAIGIERWSAIRTVIIWAHVFINCQFRSTNSTKNSFRIPFIFIPNLPGVISGFLMTFITGIIFLTTFEFYGNNVKLRMVMLTAGFIINKLSIYFYRIHFAAKVRNDLGKKNFL